MGFHTLPVASPSSLPSARSVLAKSGIAAAMLFCSFSAQAQVAVFQENFSAGLGEFTSIGSVSTANGTAILQGCYGCTDAAITSRAISTQGFTNLSLSFDRATSALDLGEAGIAEYSTDGANWTAVESTRVTSTGRVTFALPAAAAGQAALRVRFRIDASLSSETYTVDNIQLTGTSGDPGTGTPTDPGANPFAKGPAPTAALLEASTGPFTYTTTIVSGTAASGYGGGTIYHPTNVAGPFAAIAISPGYTGTKSTVSWWANGWHRTASW